MRLVSTEINVKEEEINYKIHRQAVYYYYYYYYWNKLNKQPRTADEGWSSSLGIGQGANNPSS
jgi:hypothetical protein